MAFFGVDGLEHQVKQLKAQLSSKDFEITSIRNELRKRDDDLNDMRRSKEAAEYKAQEQEERAHKAETALKQRTTELSNLRLQHDNLQATLRSANDRLKAGKKENRGLQYDNESLGHTSAEAKRILEEKEALASKVKDLEKRLAHSEDAVKSLRSGNVSQLKRSNTDFFGSTLSPVAARRTNGNRRRSTSLSSDNRVSELQAELDQLRPNIAELDKVRAQLSNVKKELDKVTNAKMALERSGKRELDELKSQMDDLNFELGEWRRNDGSGGNAKVDKVKKALAAEMDALRTRITELEKNLAEKVQEVQRLEVRVEGVVAVEAELKEQKSMTKELESKSSSTDTSHLTARIASLETALEQAKSSGVGSASHAGTASSDLTTRQLQREIKSLRAEVERQNEELANQDEEINRLLKQSASRIPLPGSPLLGSSRRDEDLARITELEGEVETVRGQIASLTRDLKEAESAARTSQKAAEDVIALKAELEARLAAASSALQTKEAQIAELETQLKEARQSAAEHQDRIKSIENAKVAAEAQCQQIQQQLDELAEKNREMADSLAASSYDAASVTAMTEDLEEQRQRVGSLGEELIICRARIEELEQATLELSGERDVAQGQAAEKQVEISTLMDRLVEAEDLLKAAVSEKKTAVKSIKEKYRETVAESTSLRLRMELAQKEVEEHRVRAEEMQDRLEEAVKAKLETENALNELKEEMGNRSSESEARQRDEELFDHREAVEKLQAMLDTERDEHAEELRLATFILTKDLEDARAQQREIERELSIASKAVGHLKLAEEKIQRLRVERDDLRISLNFVNHEQRFTSQAADAHRQALDSARFELDAKNALFTSLQNEHTEATSRFGQVSARLEVDLKAAISTQEELVERVTEMEAQLQASMADHRMQAEQSQSLVSELALARSKASRAEAELLNLRCANKQLEIRHDRAQAILEAKREAEVVMEAESLAESISTMASAELPSSATGHRRRRSGLFGPSTDLLEGLKVEKADLLGRISRRDARIHHLENEVKQLKVNLHLAHESITENEADREELASRADRLQADLDAKVAEVETLRQSLGEMTASLETSEAALAAFRIKSMDLGRDLDVATSDARMYERSLQEIIIALAAQRHNAIVAKKTWEVRERSLLAADAAIDRVRVAATAALENAKGQISSLSKQLVDLQGEAVARSGELSEVKAAEAELRQQVHAAETAADTSSRRITELESENVRLHETAARVSQLEKELDEGKQQLRLRQTDIEELLIRLASAEKARGVGEKDAEFLAETKKALDDAQAEKDALLESLSEVQQELDGAQATFDKSLAELKANTHRDIERLTGEVRSLTGVLDDKERLLMGSSKRIEQMEQELEKSRSALEQIVQQSASRQSKIDQLESDLSGTRALRDEIDTLTSALSAEKAAHKELQAELASAKEEYQLTIRERRDLDATASDRQTVIDDLKSKIETLEQADSTLRIERADLSARLVGAAEELSLVQKDVGALRATAAKQSTDLVRLERALQETKSALSEAESALSAAKDSSEDLSMQLSSVRVEKAEIEVRLVEMTKAVNESAIARVRAEELRGKVTALETQLAAQTGESGQSAETQDLQDRILELEASLSLKVQEVDEADDKVKEVYKEKVKLEKKIAKLQRQLLASAAPDAETAANTAANKAMSMRPPTETRQAPAPRSLPLPNFNQKTNDAVVPPSPRHPLRPVNVLVDKAFSPGLKRARDDRNDEKVGGVDMIFLPPAQLEQVKPTPRAIKSLRTFGENAAPRDRINVFAER